MPKRVEEVRLRMERVREGGPPSVAAVEACRRALTWEAKSEVERGVAGIEVSADAGVISKARRGRGLRIGGPWWWSSSIVRLILPNGCGWEVEWTVGVLIESRAGEATESVESGKVSVSQ